MIAALAVVFTLGSPLKPVAERGALPAFALKSLEGKVTKPADLVGEVTVLSLWATWCVPCRAELTMFQALKKERKDAFRIVAVSTDGPETVATVRSVVKQSRWDFPVLLDTQGTLIASLNPRGSVPYVVFLDRRGRVAYAHAGFEEGDAQAHAQALAQLVAESAP